MLVLREAREKVHLTQQDFAIRTGLSQVAISLIENGKVSPQANTRKRIEKVLGMRINWLATRGLQGQQQGSISSWEHVEQTFRKALHEINSLQKNEYTEFIKLARQYLKDFAEVKVEKIIRSKVILH